MPSDLEIHSCSMSEFLTASAIFPVADSLAVVGNPVADERLDILHVGRGQECSGCMPVDRVLAKTTAYDAED